MRKDTHIPPDDRFTLEDVASKAIDAGYHVHRQLGPGLLENIYERCLAMELQERGLSVECQAEVPVFYNGKAVGIGYRIDIRVNSLSSSRSSLCRKSCLCIRRSLLPT